MSGIRLVVIAVLTDSTLDLNLLTVIVKRLLLPCTAS
jgi:hypothetical protein